jgi:hypothetical protein
VTGNYRGRFEETHVQSNGDGRTPRGNPTWAGPLIDVPEAENGLQERPSGEDTTGIITERGTGMSDEPASVTDEHLSSSERVSDEGGEAGLAARVRLLEFENARLRQERDRTVQRRHRRGALGFLGLGVLSAVAGYVLPESQTLLFSLAGIGLFSAVLTYYLTGSNLISVSTIERVYLAHAETLAEIVGELGLQDVGIYVPTAGGSEREGLSNVRLFVPQQAEYELPEDVASVFIIGDDGRRRGVAVHPVGSALFAAFTESLRDPLAETPDELANQLTAALLEEFELVSEAAPEYDPANDRLTVRVRNSALGPIDRFDHPVPSFVATGLAHGLGRPIRTEVVRRDDDTTLVVCTWDDVTVADETEAARATTESASGGRPADDDAETKQTGESGANVSEEPAVGTDTDQSA